jgi:soluble lytic murein transglycosylase-like protein
MNSLFSLLFGVVLATAMIGGVFVGTAFAYEIEPRTCEVSWAEMADLLSYEDRLGVNAEWLEGINALIPDLAECSGDHNTHDHEAVQWEPLVSVFFQPEDVERVLCLMELESRGDPSAVNPSSGASGLMQVMPSWAPVFGYTVDELQDPIINLEIAAVILDDYGWDSWSPFRRGSCR